MNEFRDKLIQQFNLTNTDWEITKEYFRIERILAKSYFVKEGDIANKLGFVKSGLLRSYYCNDQAKEITLQFFQQGEVVLSPDSFNNNTPSNENIIAYEDSELITITSSKLYELYDLVPVWQRICKGVADIKNTSLSNRTLQFQTLTASQRYHKFCEDYPNTIAKVPLIHIASYLGMDIATLSRLRSKR